MPIVFIFRGSQPLACISLSTGDQSVSKHLRNERVKGRRSRRRRGGRKREAALNDKTKRLWNARQGRAMEDEGVTGENWILYWSSNTLLPIASHYRLTGMGRRAEAQATLIEIFTSQCLISENAHFQYECNFKCTSVYCSGFSFISIYVALVVPVYFLGYFLYAVFFSKKRWWRGRSVQ